jgi:hypothetical protein
MSTSINSLTVLNTTRRRLYVPFVIELQGQVVKGHALMDSGVTNNFIDQQFVERYHIPTLQKDSPRKLREIDTGKITQEVKQVFNFGEFSCELNIDVTNMGTDDAVFGMPWLEDLGAKPDFENRTIRFSSNKLRCKPNKSYIKEVVRYNHSNCHEHDIYANRSAKITAIDRAYSQQNRMRGSRAIPVARILRDLHLQKRQSPKCPDRRADRQKQAPGKRPELAGSGLCLDPKKPWCQGKKSSAPSRHE